MAAAVGPFRRGRMLAAAAALLLLAGGCAEVDYYLHLVRGQGRILWYQRPVADVLNDPTTSARVRSRLLLIEQVRVFARSHLGLHGATDNYTRYFDTGAEPVAWNISACPPDRFEAHLWTFPIVGALPYKGYFERARAEGERDRLAELGLDVVLSGVSAYSTLGYLSDPILSTMIDDAEDRLVELVLHELTHATVYVEDHTDYNESVAAFVGKQGALQFLQQRYGDDAPEVEQVQDQRRAQLAFQAFVRDVTTRLDSLYTSGATTAEILQTRERIFSDSKHAYRQQRSDLGGGRFDGYLSWQINNARLLSYRRYNSNFDGMHALLLRHNNDLSATLESLTACGDTEAPWDCIDTVPGPGPGTERPEN